MTQSVPVGLLGREPPSEKKETKNAALYSPLRDRHAENSLPPPERWIRIGGKKCKSDFVSKVSED
jgi:hypothetical protein